MSIVVMTSFNTLQQSGPISVTAEDGLGASVASVTGSFFPAVSGTVDNISYGSAIADIVAKLNATVGSWTGGYIYNENKFWLSSSTSFKTSFNGFTEKLFGFESQPSTFRQYITSSANPWFIFITEEAGRTKDTEVFERDIPYREVVTDEGRTFGLPHNGNTGFTFLGQNNQDGFMFRDWEFPNERVWKVFSQYSSSQYPYTWEAHLTEARSYHPWVMFDFNTASVVTYEDRHGTFRHRGDEANFKMQPMMRQQSQFWNIPVRARQLSRGFNFGQDPFELDTF